MKNGGFLKIVAVALSLLMLSACVSNEREGEEEQTPTPEKKTLSTEVKYPESTGFDDYEKRMEIRESYPVDEGFLEAMSSFSYETAAQLLSGKENGNYSPVSLYYALSVAATGAGGKTAEEILSLLGMPESERLSEQCENFYRNAYFDNEHGKLKIANSLWVRDGMNIGKDFADNAAEKFFASVDGVDFSSAEDMKKISDWISENTEGTLAPEKTPDPEQVLSIINTVYFYDEWISQFSKAQTKEDDFTLESGQSVKCDFMNRTTLSGFRKGDGFTASTLGLKNSGGMVFVLPEEGTSVSDLLSDKTKLKEALEGGEELYGEVIWQIPKFSFNSSFDLKEGLEALGMESAFSDLNADFTKMTDEEIFISEAIQETHIAIDENGVEASAYTELAYAGAAMPKETAEMILDRPFIYGIRTEGTWLFIGVCANPAE